MLLEATISRKLTPLMTRVLFDVRDGLGTHYRCHGRSQHGGRSRVLTALIRRGLLTRDYELTADGTAAIKAYGVGK